MSVSSLVLKLRQFSLIRDWPEIRKSEIPPSEFCPISGDWGKQGIPSMAQMSPIKCYWMLQNARITTFIISELLRENQQGGGELSPPTQIRVNCFFYINQQNYEKSWLCLQISVLPRHFYEDFKSRRWYRKMLFVHEVFKSKSLSYLFNTIPNSNTQRQARNSDNIPSSSLKMIILRILFFLLQ